MKSRWMRYMLYGVLAGLAIGVVPASAQDETPTDLTVDGGSIVVKHEAQTTAAVEVTIGDQVYVLNVPVTIQIDDSLLLEEAKLSVPTSQTVGVFAIEPVEIEVVEGAYEKLFRTVTPGADEVVVVYRGKVTNLHSETIEMGFTANFDVMAVDAVGNTYDEDTRICDDINPGATVECEFIFKAPVDTEMVDLQVKAVDYGRFAFPKGEE